MPTRGLFSGEVLVHDGRLSVSCDDLNAIMPVRETAAEPSGRRSHSCMIPTSPAEHAGEALWVAFGLWLVME